MKKTFRLVFLSLLFCAATIGAQNKKAVVKPPVKMVRFTPPKVKRPKELIDEEPGIESDACYTYTAITLKEKGYIKTKYTLETGYSTMLNSEEEEHDKSPEEEKIIEEEAKKEGNNIVVARTSTMQFTDGKSEKKGKFLNFKSKDGKIIKRFLMKLDKKKKVISLQDTSDKTIWVLGECTPKYPSVGF